MSDKTKKSESLPGVSKKKQAPNAASSSTKDKALQVSTSKGPEDANTEAEKRRKKSVDFARLYSQSFAQLRKTSEFADHQFKPSPYLIRWVHGYNNKLGVINLNDRGSTTVFYAACNFGVLYNWTTNQMRILQGHRHVVTSIAADSSGKWLVTGGTGTENVIIIWDSRTMFPQRTIFSPHGANTLARLALSHDAKYLLTLGSTPEKAELFWWIWSFGLPTPHAKIEVNVRKDPVLAMEFNPENSLQFFFMTKAEVWIGAASKILVMEQGFWKETNDYQLKVYCPPRKGKMDLGRHTSFCFVQKTAQIAVGTSRGVILIYAYSLDHTYESNTSDIENLRFIKYIKVEKCKINVIKNVDGVIVTGNKDGEIHFYDDMLKLMYWVHGFKVDSVCCLSFNLSPRSYMVVDPLCNKICPCWEKVVAETDPVTGELRTKLIKKRLPTDAKGGLPFVVRDFLICTLEGGIHFVDFVTEKLNPVLDYTVASVISISVHPEKPLICLGYQDGKVELLNFEQHKLRARINLREFYKVVIPPDDDSIHGEYTVKVPPLSVTCLKYSPSGLHLACGLNTGQVIFLDPSTIDIITKPPFKDTKFAIKSMDYSADSLTMALCDDGKTVLVYKYDCVNFQWYFVGKHRAHYKDVTSVLFLPKKNTDGNYKLLSFGADRIMVEYDIGKSYDEGLEVMSLDRMDQTATPLASIVWPSPKNLDPETQHIDMPLVLVANDEHKFKVINYNTTMTLATCLGPRYDTPVSHIILTSIKDPTTGEGRDYMLFGTKYVIGVQKMPLDGNPWKHCGMLGHPIQILRMDYRHDLTTLFTIGRRDACMCQWVVDFETTDKMARMGGNDLDPYYCLVEDGRPGWLFQEIRDLFYYIQILCQGTFSPAMRRVKDYIPIDSLPDLMRALGYFPSEYEVENLLVDAKYKIHNKLAATEVDFEDFVKLYLNHRPAFAVSIRKIKRAFKNFANYSKKEGYYWRRDDFISALCDYGEHFSRELAYYLLSILAGQSFEDRATANAVNFSFLPAKIKYEDLATTILGIPDAGTMSDKQSEMSAFGMEREDSENSDEQRTACLPPIPDWAKQTLEVVGEKPALDTAALTDTNDASASAKSEGFRFLFLEKKREAMKGIRPKEKAFIPFSQPSAA